MLFGYAHGDWQLIGVGFLLGIAGASFAVGVPFVAGWYGRERQGFALGVYGMGNIGTAIAFFGAPPVSNHWGRAAVGWITAGLLLAGAALFWLFARDAPSAGAPARYGEVLRSGWRLYRLAFFYFITFGGFVAMGFLLPTLLQDWFGYSKGEAGARAAGFIIAATIARPVGGCGVGSRRRVPGARPRVRRYRRRRSGPRGPRAVAQDRADHDRVPDARRLSRQR